jgi:DNA helicase-2/ATP-dependent DNA helicase PcrA
VYVLNVTDGSFPSEFATGRAEAIDEERRLLYVAMTRAKRDLHLLAPVRFYITQQSPVGDRYVTSARSRFMSEAVLSRFERQSWPAGGEEPRDQAVRGPPIDVGARLKAMW